MLLLYLVRTCGLPAGSLHLSMSVYTVRSASLGIFYVPSVYCNRRRYFLHYFPGSYLVLCQQVLCQQPSKDSLPGGDKEGVGLNVSRKDAVIPVFRSPESFISV